jgi:serine/threonine protein kinase
MTNGVVPRLDLPPIKALFIISAEEPPGLEEPDEWNEDIKDFLKMCLEKDPNHRKTAKELMDHPFIKNSYENTDFVKDLIKNAREAKKNKKTLSKMMDALMNEEEPQNFDDEEEFGI